MKKIIFSILIVLSVKGFSQNRPLAIEEFKLKNGMQVKMIDFGSIPAVSLSCFINVGKKTETPGQQYLANITSSSLSLGNEKYSRVAQDNVIAKLGAALGSMTNNNYTEISMRFLNKDAAAAMDLFSSMLLKPLFPPTDIKQQVEQTLNYNNPYKMDISAIAGMFSDYVLFGTAHPVGRHFYATQLNKITSKEVTEFYKFNYTPKNTVLVLAGNFDHAAMKAMIESMFGSWTAAYGENNRAAYDVQPVSKKEYFFINKNRATQAFLRWNKKSPEAGSKDVIPFDMANTAFNTLLFEEIRAKEGKTYGINSIYNESGTSGFYSITTQVRNDVAYETTVSFDRVLKQFYDKGITQAELDKAKAALKNDRLAIESPSEIIEFYNPMIYKDPAKRNEYITAVDAMNLEQVNKIIKKYFAPESYKLVMVGDQTILEPQLQKIKDLVRLPVTSIEKDN
ncbi:MAG: peptidase domain protein [Bacteroidota bacterium]|jgi:predicted Zn-dependent peptidase|nr:peptidase domain protein [Bacteroidota bacterium]